jgi:hypothetical protein
MISFAYILLPYKALNSPVCFVLSRDGIRIFFLMFSIQKTVVESLLVRFFVVYRVDR